MLSRLSFVEPHLPTLAAHPPQGEGWQHEIKYDGYRTQLLIEPAGTRAFTRKGFDWTHHYRPIVEAASSLSLVPALIDGEMIIQDEQGRPDFHNFRATMINHPERLIFMAFDLLHLGDRDLRRDPLIDRRARLLDLVGPHLPFQRIQFSEHVIGDGDALFAAADQMGLEGIVSKKLSSRYRSGAQKSWLKIKCFAEDIFTVIGTIRGDGPAYALVSRNTASGPVYAGSAMITLPEPHRNLFWRVVDALRTIDPPLPIPKGITADWVKPGLQIKVRYLKGSDKLRHATVLEIEG